MSDNIFSKSSMADWAWHDNVAQILPYYDIDSHSPSRLLSLSENATYLVSSQSHQKQFVLRLSRPNYRSIEEIRSELDWIARIRATLPDVKTPAFILNQAGEMITTYRDDQGREQYAVLFEFIQGSHPHAGNMTYAFTKLGMMAASLHRSSSSINDIASFSRPSWTVTTTVGKNAHWGCWREHHMVRDEIALCFNLVEEKIAQELNAYGHGRNVWGLIHGDMRLTNQLVLGEDLYLIDFDDCGFSWYLYELACSLSFIEHEDNVPELVAAWLNSYHQICPLQKEDIAIVPALVMLRRLLLVGWFSTHEYHSDQELMALADRYVPDTQLLAKRYLANAFLSDIAKDLDNVFCAASL